MSEVRGVSSLLSHEYFAGTNMGGVGPGIGKREEAFFAILKLCMYEYIVRFPKDLQNSVNAGRTIPEASVPRICTNDCGLRKSLALKNAHLNMKYCHHSSVEMTWQMLEELVISNLH